MLALWTNTQQKTVYRSVLWVQNKNVQTENVLFGTHNYQLKCLWQTTEKNLHRTQINITNISLKKCMHKNTITTQLCI